MRDRDRIQDQDRVLGCVLGGAMGDGLGAAHEGSLVGVDLDQRDENLSLRITDDTQLTLATCEAIIERQAVDPAMIAKHFLRWFRERRLTGLGASTLKAL
ncbi:MAG: ADP-ribosylglycohydrolase family protein, partial [Planctomycetales bacterium]